MSRPIFVCVLTVNCLKLCMLGSREFCQKVSNFDGLFLVILVDEVREDHNTTIRGSHVPPSGSTHVVYKCCMILCVTFPSFISAPDTKA